MHQSVNKWHLILIAIVVAIGLVLMLPHGSKSTSAVSITPSTAGYTSLEKAYLTLARSEASSDSDALSKVSDYCNRYPNLSDVEATDFGVNLGIIEVTATDWSNKESRSAERPLERLRSRLHLRSERHVLRSKSDGSAPGQLRPADTAECRQSHERGRQLPHHRTGGAAPAEVSCAAAPHLVGPCLQL